MVKLGREISQPREKLTLLSLSHNEFKHHPVEYEKLLSTQGVGPKTIRALSAAPSYEDPARYSFTHGGKDATPYPVDTKTYDVTIQTSQEIVRKTKLNPVDKDKALKRLLPQPS